MQLTALVANDDTRAFMNIHRCHIRVVSRTNNERLKPKWPAATLILRLLYMKETSQVLVLSGLLSDETAKTIISAVTLNGSVEQCYK